MIEVNYNMRVEIERVNGVFVTQMEMSNYMVCRREVLRLQTLDESMAEISAFKERVMKEMIASSQPHDVKVVEPPPAKVIATDEKSAEKAAAKVTAALKKGQKKVTKNRASTKRRFAAA